jgi:hypothetical protein
MEVRIWGPRVLADGSLGSRLLDHRWHDVRGSGPVRYDKLPALVANQLRSYSTETAWPDAGSAAERSGLVAGVITRSVFRTLRHAARVGNSCRTFARVVRRPTKEVGMTDEAIGMLDDVCFHDKAQALQRQAATVLRTVARASEADHWQALADRYGDWEAFTDQEIPGHVHLCPPAQDE